MFLGHFALAFAAKRLAPRTSLGTLVVAAQLPDVLWPVFLLLGWEQVHITPSGNPFLAMTFDAYPWSHSLLADAFWGAFFGGGYWLVRKDRAGALAIFLLVVSHWVLDVASHAPDMPLAPGEGTKLGLGLWNSVLATMIVEVLLFAPCVALYFSATHARDAIGRYAIGAFVLVLSVLYVGNAFGPPPPGWEAVAWVGIAGGALFWAWAAWGDRHRAPVAA